jgi:hypothetical protein
MPSTTFGVVSIGDGPVQSGLPVVASNARSLPVGESAGVAM